jgi:hypothetical protein
VSEGLKTGAQMLVSLFDLLDCDSSSHSRCPSHSMQHNINNASNGIRNIANAANRVCPHCNTRN